MYERYKRPQPFFDGRYSGGLSEPQQQVVKIGERRIGLQDFLATIPERRKEFVNLPFATQIARIAVASGLSSHGFRLSEYIVKRRVVDFPKSHENGSMNRNLLDDETAKVVAVLAIAERMLMDDSKKPYDSTRKFVFEGWVNKARELLEGDRLQERIKDPREYGVSAKKQKVLYDGKRK